LNQFSTQRSVIASPYSTYRVVQVTDGLANHIAIVA
jgi:hypothetical protein